MGKDDRHEKVTAGLSDQATITLLSAAGERAKARHVEAKRTKAASEADAKTTPQRLLQFGQHFKPFAVRHIAFCRRIAHGAVPGALTPALA